jgi:hypothetical protein
VLTLDDNSKRDWPAITVQCTVGDDDKSLDTPLNGLQHSLIAAAIKQNSDQPVDDQTAANQARSLKTYGDAFSLFHPDLMNNNPGH